MRIRYSFAMAAALALAACGSEPASDGAASDGAAVAGAQTAQAPAPAATGNQPPAAFMQCRACHAVEPGRHGVGPSLAGVYGTKAGEIAGYAFSDAMKNSGLTWDDATLDRYLAAPMQLVPGTRMVYPGQPDPAKRKELVEYIKSLK